MRFAFVFFLVFCVNYAAFAVERMVEVDAAYQSLYQALKQRLVEVEDALANQSSADQIMPLKFAKPILREGDVDPHVFLLRLKMAAFLDGDSALTGGDIYDAPLVDAVKRFQRQNGMNDDGVVGPETLAVMNRSLDKEREQIIVNINRLQQPEWQNRPELRIDVDVVRYHLTAYEDGEPVFDMPVVVGSPARQTNIFSTVMTGVRLNPSWTLPETVKAEDYMPKLRDDPQWVVDQGVKIYTSWDKDAQPIDPMTLDWNYVSDNAIQAMRFHKRAGDNNPLGQYRFLMNNKHDIYLHDTNQRYMFSHSDRAQSSGCARLSDPRKIAEFLLKDNPDWTSERLSDILDSGETYDIGAKRSIPVYFDYKTAWMDKDGKLILGRDIYGLDSERYSDILNENDDLFVGTNQKSLEDSL